jgi:hypothetical protein
MTLAAFDRLQMHIQHLKIVIFDREKNNSGKEALTFKFSTKHIYKLLFVK